MNMVAAIAFIVLVAVLVVGGTVVSTYLYRVALRRGAARPQIGTVALNQEAYYEMEQEFYESIGAQPQSMNMFTRRFLLAALSLFVFIGLLIALFVNFIH